MKNQWIKCKDKTPPPCTQLIVVKIGKMGVPMIDWYYTSTHPLECVEDDKLTHWMIVPRMPTED